MAVPGKLSRIRPSVVWFLLALVSPVSGESFLAHQFSRRLQVLEARNEVIADKLSQLPSIPQDDSGGMETYAKYYPTVGAGADLSVNSCIRFMWPDSAKVDLVALVPARKFTPTGLDPEYGFPNDYSLTLLDADGSPIHAVACEESTAASPVARGGPYLYPLASPIEAHGLELKITRLRPIQPNRPQLLFFALSEIFCFSGETNLMSDSRISFSYDETQNTSPYWDPYFMVDELTPLGLPERPLPDGREWNAIGWISRGSTSEDSSVRITIDLGRLAEIDGLRIFPAIRPSLMTVPGFGIPPRYQIQTSRDSAPNSFRTVFESNHLGRSNPGNNPTTDRFPKTKTRFVRIVTERLWKPFQHYPAFFASSEIQVLSGEQNLAIGASVFPSENTEPFAAQGKYRWSPASLTDNHGPSGLILSRRTWLEQLGERKVLESELQNHLSEMALIHHRYGVGTTVSLWTTATLALLVAVTLPFRFRFRERRKIRKIRDRIAGDLHDDVGSNLGSIQLLAGTAQGKSDNHEELHLIDQIAAETVTSVRDIVWLLRPKPGERVSTISHLRESASFLLDPIEWKLTTDLDDFAVSDEDGRNLVLFFREALHNLIRHSGAQNAEIRITRLGKALSLEIEDDGCGISPAQLGKKGALRALKQRSKSLGGTFDIQSKEGNGTILKLVFTPQPATASRSLRYPFPGKT